MKTLLRISWVFIWLRNFLGVLFCVFNSRQGHFEMTKVCSAYKNNPGVMTNLKSSSPPKDIITKHTTKNNTSNICPHAFPTPILRAVMAGG